MGSPRNTTSWGLHDVPPKLDGFGGLWKVWLGHEKGAESVPWAEDFQSSVRATELFFVDEGPLPVGNSGTPSFVTIVGF